mgnify:CR=1 FL=1
MNHVHHLHHNNIKLYDQNTLKKYQNNHGS